MGTGATTSAAATQNTTATDTASCGTLTVLGGGIILSLVGTGATGLDYMVDIKAAYPDTATHWTATGVVTNGLPPGIQMSVQAYAICALQ